MKNKNFFSIALLIIAVAAISIVCGMAVYNLDNSTSFAYELGRASGQMARPYLIGLGVIAILLISIRLQRKSR